MTVGIYLGYLYVTEGGGFTFQETIVEEMLQAETDHEFVFFFSGTNIFANHKLGKHKVVRLHMNSMWGPVVFRFFYWLRRAGIWLMKKKYPDQKLQTWFDWWVKEHNVQLLWFPGFKDLETDIPFIYTIWDLQHRLQPFFPEVSANGEWKTREKLFSKMIRRATYLITGTETGKKELQLFYGIDGERIKLLLHPTPKFALQMGKDKIPVKLKIPPDFIFYPAQFWPHKNHITLLKALHHLKFKHNRIINAVLVGHNYGNKDYISRKAKELKVDEQIFMFGFLDRSDLVSLYQNAQALVYISHFGPENLPPLEAMAFGCPVIYGDVPGAEEQLGNNALIVDRLSPEKIAEAIINVLDDSTIRNTLIQRGHTRAVAYTPTHYVRDLIKVVDEFSPIRQCWK